MGQEVSGKGEARHRGALALALVSPSSGRGGMVVVGEKGFARVPAPVMQLMQQKEKEGLAFLHVGIYIPKMSAHCS
eukprot:329520-Chlamydomonas_euryale.AAC.6